MTEQPAVPSYRLTAVFFALTAIATMVGFVLWALISTPIAPGSGVSNLVRLGVVLPAIAATLAFAFLSQGMAGRRRQALTLVFGGTAVATILSLSVLPSLYLITSAVLAGSVSTLAKRLLSDPTAA